jgi:glycosyltransferase involved in cell wall biosynthesis
MKIIFGINNFENAGAENFMLRLAAYFLKKGHHVALFSLNSISDSNERRIIELFPEESKRLELIQSYIPKKIEDKLIWRINGFGNRIGIKNIRNRYLKYRTMQKIKNFKPEIINSHLFETDLFFTETIKIPHLISMHGSYEYYLYKTINDDGDSNEKRTDVSLLNYEFIKSAEKVLKSSQNIIYCADKNLEILSHLNLTNLRLKKIFYGIEKRTVTIHPKKDFTIGMFARGVKSKGWEILIESYLKIRNNYPNLKLKLIFSETAYMNSLRSKYDKTDVIFHGFEPKIETQINSFDLVVFPTLYPGESLPNTVIESITYNVPVLSTFHAEIPKMIEYKGVKAGTIIAIDGLSFNNQVNVFSKAIETYLINPILYREHKENCRVVSTQFEMEICYKKYLSFFEENIRQCKK